MAILSQVGIVTICKHKRPQGWGRWLGYSLDIDEYGTWAYTPAHSTFLSDDEAGQRGRCEVAQDRQQRGRPCVVLLSTSSWFVAHWVPADDYVVTVDISTPPTRSDQTWRYEDLELDPYLLPDGTFGVEDTDEFDAACAEGLITSEERRAARSSVARLREELTAPDSPLLEAGCRRLADAVRLGLPPLLADHADEGS